MFISVLDLFKVGIGPSSSHTFGPMVAAKDFVDRIRKQPELLAHDSAMHLRCTLKGSLAFTGKGHATDHAIALGAHGYTPKMLTTEDVNTLVKRIYGQQQLMLGKAVVSFTPEQDIIFDFGKALPEHANGMIFELCDQAGNIVLTDTYFSIGGGFITTRQAMLESTDSQQNADGVQSPYPFGSVSALLSMCAESGLSVAMVKRANECARRTDQALDQGLDEIWLAMKACVENGLHSEGTLPGGLNVARRAKGLYQQLQANPEQAQVHEWLCAYAMAVNEENAAGHMVVTSPTNGAAGVIAAVLYYLVNHEGCSTEQIREFLLAASSVGSLIKNRSSISGAEVGCQGEIGSASSMAAAGLCAIRGGTPEQIEHAAEMALEHHLGMTCDPVNGLVQIPCIERNGFGAIKAYVAASLAMRETGQHQVSLDRCIAAMKEIGLEMSEKYKETSLGGLAVSVIEC